MSIWKYKFKIGKKYQLSLGEGETPITKCSSLKEFFKLEKLYLKREDLNPNGSFKDRSLAYQMSYYYQKGFDKFIISSSGNAAISAASYSQLFKCHLDIFISKNIPPDKFKRLLKACKVRNLDQITLKKKKISLKNINIFISKRPKSQSIKYLNINKNYVNLRGSTDPAAIKGFKTIAYELASISKKADSIFIPCSSGTSSVGIAKGFRDMGLKIPPIHIVQTTKIHPIASNFDNSFSKTPKSKATAISDRVANRKEDVIRIIQKSKGSGWVINDKRVLEAQNLLLEKCKINVSTDASLSLAGLQKAIDSGYNIKKPILIISGK